MDFSRIPTPCYVLDERLLHENLVKIARVKQEAEVKVICALKGFSFSRALPMVKQYLDGAAASSLHEARLCFEAMGVGAHVYSPAYLEKEFEAIQSYASCISFNSLRQWDLYKSRCKTDGSVQYGLRINPEYSEVKTDIYNPAIPASRLGIISDKLGDRLPEGISGLHFHVLCENNSYTLERTLQYVEKRFDRWLKQCEWLNMGGGHLITHRDYDVDHLIRTLRAFKSKYPHLSIILEPGQAVGLNTGYLVTTILDVVDNRGTKTLVFDASFSCHMPDVLEYPYRPGVMGARDPKEGETGYRLGGITCLAGDAIDPYVFDKEPTVGDTLVFEDQIHYTMVKTSHFNGVGLPSIGIWREDNTFELVKTFGYREFVERL